MPVQKGKKKTKRERRQFGRIASWTDEDDADSASTPAREKPKAMRRGREASPRVNIFIGIAVLVLGVYFFLAFGGFQVSGLLIRLLLFALYLALGGFYIWKAMRQRQAS